MFAEYEERYKNLKSSLEKSQESLEQFVNDLKSDLLFFSQSLISDELRAYYFDEVLPPLIEIILERNYSSLPFDFYSSIYQYLLLLLEKTLERLKDYSNGALAVVEKLLNPNKKFYNKKITPVPDSEIIQLLEKFLITKPNCFEVFSNLNLTNAYFLVIFNFFTVNSGFLILAKFINNRPEFEMIKNIVCLMIENKDILSRIKFEESGEVIWNNIENMMKNLKIEEIKCLKKTEFNVLMSKINYFLQILYDPEKSAQKIESIELEIAFQLFDSPFLDKKVLGLEEINRKIEQVRQLDSKNFNSPMPDRANWLSKSILLKYFEEKNIFHMLFGEKLHPEIVKKSFEIVKFLYQNRAFEFEKIQEVFEIALSRHDAYKESLLSIIDDLITILRGNDLTKLLKVVKNVNLCEIDIKILRIIKSFTFISQKQISKIVNVRENEYNSTDVLHFLWELWQENSVNNGIPIEMAKKALDIFQESLIHRFKDQRTEFIHKCIENISNNTQMTYTCELLQHIFESFPSSASQVRVGDSKQSIISNFFSLFINNLFKSFLKHKQKLINDIESVENYSHLESFDNCQQKYLKNSPNSYLEDLKFQLDFLKYIYRNCPNLISDSQFLFIWDAFILNSISPKEQDLIFNWFSSFIGMLEIKVFDFEILFNIYSNFVLKVNPSHFTISSFNCFEKYFIYINSKYNLLKASEYSFEILNLNLISFKFLWKIFLNAILEQVFIESTSLLQKIYSNYKNHSFASKKEFLDLYCFPQIFEISQSLGSDPSASNKIFRVMQIVLDILSSPENKVSLKIDTKVQVDSFEIPVLIKNKTEKNYKKEVLIENFYNTTVWRSVKEVLAEKFSKSLQDLVFFHNKKQLDDSEDSLTLEQLDFVSGSSVVVRQCSGGGEKMRVSDYALKQVKNILPDFENDLIEQALIKSAGDPDRAVDILFDPDIVDQLRVELSNKEMKQRDLNTQKNIKGILKNKVNPNQAHDAVQQATEKIDIKSKRLAKAIAEDGELLRKLFSISAKLDENTNLKVWEMLNFLPFNEKIYNGFESETFFFHFNEIIGSKVILKVVYYLKMINDYLQKKASFEWIQNFFDEGGFYFLYENFNKFFEGEKVMMQNIYLEYLLQIILFFFSKDSRTAEYRFSSVFDMIDANGLIINLLKLIQISLESQEKSEIIIEKSFDFVVTLVEFNSTLLLEIYSNHIVPKIIEIGFFQISSQILREKLKKFIIIITSLEKFPIDMHEPSQFFWNILSKYFENPTQEKSKEFFDTILHLLEKNLIYPEDLLENCIKFVLNREINEENGEDFTLGGYLQIILTLLNKESTPNSLRLLSFLYTCLFDLNIGSDALKGGKRPPMIKKNVTRSISISLIMTLSKFGEAEFQFLSSKLYSHHSVGRLTRIPVMDSSAKSSLGYVGLRNFGSTCYLNSLMQQLYMMVPIREGLLKVGLDSKQSTSSSLFYQLQILLLNLKYSEQQCYSPEGFCASFKGYDGEPLNIRVQQDADEFLNLLFDKLEESLKETGHSSLLRDYIGGNIVHLINSTESNYPYKGERLEHFFRVSLDIKNKSNLYEALDFYVKEDLLEGDNKYLCEEFNAKINVTKKCLLDSLSNTIFIHLKRFEFNFAELKRVKINDKFEFPESINLKKWCRESSEDREDSYYEYDLVGIIIHSGSAESGHYYSYIKDRESLKWLKFDDRYVENYNIKNLVNDCFGGKNPNFGKNEFQEPENCFSAYILVYERKVPREVPEVVLEDSSNVDGVSQILQEIRLENKMFLEDSLFLEKNYHELITTTLYKNDFQESNEGGIENSVGSDLKISKLVKDYLDETMSMFNMSKSDLLNDKNYEAIKIKCENEEILKENSFLPIKTLTLHAFELVLRVKNYSAFEELIKKLTTLYKKHLPACNWLLNLLCSNFSILTSLVSELENKESSKIFNKFLLKIIVKVIVSEEKYLEETFEVYKIKFLPFDPEVFYINITQYVKRFNYSTAVRFLKKYFSKVFVTKNSAKNIESIIEFIKSLYMNLPQCIKLIVDFEVICDMICLFRETKKLALDQSHKILIFFEDFINDLNPSPSKSNLKVIEEIKNQMIKDIMFVTEIIDMVPLKSVKCIIQFLCDNNSEISKKIMPLLLENLIMSKYDNQITEANLKVLRNLLLIKDSEQDTRIKIVLTIPLQRYGRVFFEEIASLSNTCIGFLCALIIWLGELLQEVPIYNKIKDFRSQFTWINSVFFEMNKCKGYNFKGTLVDMERLFENSKRFLKVHFNLN